MLSVLPRTTFYYDPQRQGFDTSYWRTLYGSLVTVNGELRINEASIIHYGDILKGELNFKVTVPNSPVGGETRSWGLKGLGSGAYILFDIADEVFSVKVSNGTDTASETIIWESAWSGSAIYYQIIWEAGTAKFSINGSHLKTITDVAVPSEPLSLFFENENNDNFTVSYLSAKALQYYYLNKDHEDTSVNEPMSFFSDSISIAEDIAQTQEFTTDDDADSISITEDVSTEWTLGNESSDSLTIAEQVSVSTT